MILTLPTLYKRTSTGKTEQWSTWVTGAEIFTEHGQVGGKLQVSSEVIKIGKNIGKANETSAAEQAEKEARAEWTKKIERKGYVEDQARAEAGERDQKSPLLPMLAKVFEDHKGKLRWPCIFQRKYNGIRCIAYWDGSNVTLWTRGGEAIVVPVPHVIEALEVLFEGRTEPCVLDGELYRHGWTLQKIASYTRQKTTVKPGYMEIQYHVYDLPSHPGTNEERDSARAKVLEYAGHPLVYVDSMMCESDVAAKLLHDAAVMDGFEGGILRNQDAKYQPGRRSPDLQKLKVFDSTEFEITGVKQGRGKFEGLAVFECRTANGGVFDCCAPGTLEDRAEVLANGPSYIGKHLTVKHFGWTESQLPSCPVPEAVRDYE